MLPNPEEGRTMPVLDKAVSTEDLCADEVSSTFGVLRLDAILNTLVENKVEALKQENDKNSSLHSSPRNFLGKLKFHSSPKTNFKIEDEKKTESRKKDRKVHVQRTVSGSRQFKRQVLRQETSSPESQTLHVEENCSKGSSCQSQSCYYSQLKPHQLSGDEYIEIKMEGFEGDVETEAMIAREELKRARRKHRRRRKRRLKKRLALNSHLVDTQESVFKALNEDELPPRAKWTIVATACLLLFLCLLLVAITLRMAPLIDEIVREENEKLINSISNSANASVHNGVASAENLYVK
ncbi:uncharacterized protein [Euwallacea fornicatus]|uniref:uncharacterized protein n=1 Tax=Euwallacea fornicatus TaxID=995702 RepID=UPI00338E1AB1